MTTKKTTFADRYREQLQKQEIEPEIVDVQVPSGSIFKFQKPSTFGMLFDIGSLPVSATSGAITKWQENGVAEFDKSEVGDQLQLADMLIRARDKVLELSHEPKLVLGVADEAKGEFSIKNVADPDKAFLLNWVLAGGDTSRIQMLGKFPSGPEPGPLAGANRSTRRATAKQTRRN